VSILSDLRISRCSDVSVLFSCHGIADRLPNARFTRRRERSEPRSAATGSSTASFCEHLLESLKHGCDALRLQATEATDQPFSIDGPQLIQSDEPRAPPKATRHAPWIGVSGGRHWRHNDCPQVFVQLVW